MSQKQFPKAGYVYWDEDGAYFAFGESIQDIAPEAGVKRRIARYELKEVVLAETVVRSSLDVSSPRRSAPAARK